jgi:putative ABC transport system permease protein
MILDKLHEWTTRLRFFFSRREPREVDDELQFHIEQQIETNRAAGMSEVEARRQALIAFGGVENSREACSEQRPSWLLETLAQDVRYGFRGLRRNPAYAITAILTLALGIGITTAVFSVVDRILFRSLPYADAGRLVSAGLTAPISANEFLLTDSYYEWRDHQVPFAAITSEQGTEPCDLTEEKPARLNCSRVEASFLSTLGVTPLLGRGFTPEEDQPNAPKVALISYGLWKSSFALNPAVLNKTISVDGHATRVIGVLPKDFEMPTLEASDILVPQALDQAVVSVPNSNAVTIVYVFARLKPGISIEQAQAALKPMFDYSLSKAPPRFRNEVHLKVRSLRDRQMQHVSLTAWLLFGTVMIVLLIACANVASLMMARGAAREHELAIRAALGASRARLVRQTLTEALLLFLTAAFAGCVVAEITLRIFIALAPDGIPFLNQAHIDLRVFLFTIMVSLLCAVLFGLAPALQKPRAEALGGRSMGSHARAVLRQWLVAAEIAGSMVLLVGGMLLFRSFWKLENQQLGIVTASIVTARLSLGQQSYPTQQSQMAFFQHLEARLRRLPGVKALALSDAIPPAGYEHSMLYGVIGVEGKPKPEGGTGGTVWWRWVSPEYFSALRIPLLQGEGFTAEEQNSNSHFIVLSKMLSERMFPQENPIGQHLQLGQGPWYTVVGVAANVKNGGLSGEQLPELYRLRRNRAEDWNTSGAVILETAFATSAVESWVRSEIADVDPTLPVQVDTLHHTVQRIADRPRFETMLVSCFAIVGLLLAVVGLYGVIAFLVAQRRREIGLRMALGATRVDIVRLVVARGMVLVAVGGITGIIVASFLSRLLSSLLFSVGPHDPLSLLGVTLALVVVALLAMLLPAFSAMKVDPNEALRCE